MKIDTMNPLNVFGPWRRYVGVSLRAGLAIASIGLLLFLLMAGCKKSDTSLGSVPIALQVGTSATLGTTSVFKETIMADQSISLNTGATVEGRLLPRVAAVALTGNTVVKPAL